MKFHPVVAELFHADRWTIWQTDKYDKDSFCFLQFCECT